MRAGRAEEEEEEKEGRRGGKGREGGLAASRPMSCLREFRGAK